MKTSIRSVKLLALIAIVCAGVLRGGILLELSSTMLEGMPGDDLQVSGTLSNTTIGTFYLNGTSSNLASFDLALDDSPFYEYVPFTLAEGELYSGPLFDIVIGANALPGIYDGSFAVLGGLDPDSLDELARAGFEVQVDAAVPEPTVAGLVAAGLLSLLLCRRSSGQSQQNERQSRRATPLIRR